MIRGCRFLVSLAFSTALSTVGCSPSSPTDCPTHATFRLTVDTQDGHVPDDATINVKYGSGEEAFEARYPDAPLKVVFCNLERDGVGDAGGPGADGGEDVGPIRRIVCDLWTDGAATVTVEAHGYVEVERTLEAERDEECGLALTEERITLERK